MEFGALLKVPQYIEDHVLKLASSSKGKKSINLKEIVPAVKELTEILTVERERLKEGLPYRDKDLLHAYLLYILPQSFAKVVTVLAEIDSYRYFPEKDVLKVGDFGCGPGPAVMGLIWYLARRKKKPRVVEVTAVDYRFDLLEMMEPVLRNMMEEESPGIKVRLTPVKADMESMLEGAPLKERYDFLFMVNVLNELFIGEGVEKRSALLRRFLGRNLTREGMAIIIEPSLKKVSRDLMKLRGELVSAGFNVVAPCPPEGSQCPYLTYRTKKDWCHFKFSYEPPEVMKQVAVLTRRDSRKIIKWSYLIFSHTRKNPFTDLFDSFEGEYLWRAISPSIEEKGKYKCFACAGSQVLKFEMLWREVEDYEGFPSLKRGDIAQVKSAEKKGSALRITSPYDFQVLWSRDAITLP